MAHVPTLLLVDDEPNILKALVRLLRPVGYNILTAENGADALVLLAQHSVDLVLSDMRMPIMDGSLFLSKVKDHWPDTVRLLLTGHADMQQTISAINQGEIYRFIAKPWDDQELIITIRQALEQQHLKRDNIRLLALTVEQNEALQEANKTLEKRVEQRTHELEQLVGFLEISQHEIKTAFSLCIQVLSGVTEMRFPDWTGHARRVSESAHRLALAVKLKSDELEAVEQAALLHDIGKISLPDELLFKSYASHNRAERDEFMHHPAQGQMVLLPIEKLSQTGLFIRHQHEQLDGQGFPDKLHGDSIPIGARILAIARDYDELQMGLLLSQPVSAEHARLYLKENTKTKYDEELVRVFIAIVEKGEEKIKEVALQSSQLQPGMVLSRDLYSSSRFLLLTKGRQLDASIIKHIWHFEQVEKKNVVVYIRQK